MEHTDAERLAFVQAALKAGQDVVFQPLRLNGKRPISLSTTRGMCLGETVNEAIDAAIDGVWQDHL